MMYVKGSLVSRVPEFIEEKFGEYGLTKWKRSLSQQALDIYNGKMPRDEMYPLGISLVKPLETACELFYNGSVRGSIEFGRYVADEKQKTGGLLNRDVLHSRLNPSPSAKIKRQCEKLQSVFSSAEVEVTDHTGSSSVIQMKHFPEMGDIMEVMIAGWLQVKLEKDLDMAVAIEIKNASGGKQPVEYIVKWKKE